jgi:hypothetical protein
VTSLAGIVSEAVPPPVVQSVAEATVVQLAASRARVSLTVTVPSEFVIVSPGAPEPRSIVTGAETVSAPEVTVNVTVVLADGPGAAGCAVAADAKAGATASAVVAAAATASTRNADLTIIPPGKSRSPRTRLLRVFTL